MDALEPHLDFGDISKITGNSRDWVRRAWKRGEFGPRYIDTSSGCSGYEIRIPESGVRAYLERRTFNLSGKQNPKIAVA